MNIETVYVIVHDIDGQALRGEASQTALAALAAIPQVPSHRPIGSCVSMRSCQFMMFDQTNDLMLGPFHRLVQPPEYRTSVGRPESSLIRLAMGGDFNS